MLFQDPIVVIGCSHGCVEALLRLTRKFDARWRTSIFITVHTGRWKSALPELLGGDCPMPMAHGRDGELIERGRVYMAPADRHLCIEAQYIRLSRGPRENWTRPAIDPMFRSAACTHGPWVIGVLLTGRLHDGVNGLSMIHQCGGRTIVQDPSDALSPEMPRNALRQIKPTCVLPLSEVPQAIGECLTQMSGLPEYVGAAHG
jgi:two-component system, chemotaxis family, protein-glutamate methylesterase/glutaminase